MGLDIIRQTPWTGPLDLTLHAADKGDVRYPFASFVRLPKGLSSQALFTNFARLPAELQLHIVSFCDTTTLFQLMHTNAFLRTEACKFFWSSTEAWYYVEGKWLLCGGFPGHGNHAMDILAHIQQLEVDFKSTLKFWANWKDGRRQGYVNPLEPEVYHRMVDFDIKPNATTTQFLEQRARIFWQVLRDKFPRVKRVVLTESCAVGLEWKVGFELGTLATMCPDDIAVTVSRLQAPWQNRTLLQRNLWGLVQNRDGTATWKALSMGWSHTSVLLPPKEFRGPVGTYCYLAYQAQRYNARKYMALLVLIEAIERHHFEGRHEPFTCPMCETRFEARREWTLHAINNIHHKKAVPPEDLAEAFAKNDRVLYEMEKERQEGVAKLWLEWGEEGSEQRQQAKQAFLEQLEHDPLYAREKPPQESAIWLWYEMEMNWDPNSEPRHMLRRRLSDDGCSYFINQVLHETEYF